MDRSALIAKGLAVLLGAGLTACGPDSSSVTGAGDSDTADVDTGESPTTGDDDTTGAMTGGADGNGDGGGESSTAAEPEFVPYPARGVRLSEVFANQGVGVPIVRDGAWVDGSGRNAALIPGRTTMIRGYWELDDDFEPRSIMARLTLTMPDGTQEVAERPFEVKEESTPSQIDTNMYFVIPGELIPVGVQFQIELFETQNGFEDLPEPDQTAYPPQPSFLGTEDKDLAIKIVLVPIKHNINRECPEAPEITDEEMQFFSDQLLMQNPAQRIEIERRDPIDYTNGLSSFSPLLSFLAELRATDNADPAAYYYGVVRPCDGGADGVGGQAISIPDFPTIDNAWTRVSMGRWTNSLSSTANTFVHEIGHSQGRRHVFCNGDEGGPDPSYPYPEGDIGIWGFGIVDFTLYTPTNGKDYMTYCGNTWVSDWTWGKVLPFIEEITSWSASDAGRRPEGRVLVGLVDPATGTESWFVTEGKAEGLVTDGTEPMHFAAPDVGAMDLDGVYGPVGEGDGYVVAVDLPPGLDINPSLQVTREHAGQNLPVVNISVASESLALPQ